ncbi:DUF1566 domain-containing protein [Candidatus Woesearchaeota archaeon]|nr:DUF1566 domain-containing protein [Candidatus Woesearchaeota archaeon]
MNVYLDSKKMKMANGKLNAFKRIVSNKIVRTLASLVLIAGGMTLSPKKLNSYETGTMKEQSIHPLLVDKLEKYAQIPKSIYFDTDEVKKGTINEDSPEDAYVRAFNHFTHNLKGFSSSIEWALNPELQSDYPFGDHSWPRVVDTYQQNSEIGYDFGFIYHLIADLTSPAHVHQDIHPFYDSYESWTDKHKGEIMDLVEKPSQTPKFDTLEELMEDLGDFTRNNFSSDDAWGDSLNGLYKTDYGNKQYWVKTIDAKEVRILRRSFFLNFRDDDCFRDQWSALGTKAVVYGLAALKLLTKNGTCTPDCNSKWCGDDDGCGGFCQNCGAGFHCVDNNYCASNCQPDCNGKECGDNGCGGSCGNCYDDQKCQSGKCVSLGEFNGKDNGDGTVTDLNTGLIWQKETGGKKTWEGAILYCKSLPLAGYSDWVLPKIDELRTLIVGCPATEPGGSCEVVDGCGTKCPGAEGSCKIGCALNEGPSNGCYMDSLLDNNCQHYWSSSIDMSETDRAWRLHFDMGLMYPDQKYGEYYVRCVINKD